MIIIRDPAISPFVIKEDRQGFYVESIDNSFKPRKVENLNMALQVIIEEKKYRELDNTTVSLQQYFKFSSDKEEELRIAFSGNTNNESKGNDESIATVTDSTQGTFEEESSEVANLQQA